MSAVSPLFSPATIGGATLKNRLVRTATIECIARDGKHVPDAYVDLYRRLARGGAGLVIAGNFFVQEVGRAQPGIVVDTDEVIPELEKVTRAVREEGGVIFAQLNHGGRQASPKLIGRKPVAPSAVRDTVTLVRPRAMTRSEVEGTIAAYVSAARRVKAAGFGGVQINGAHGYLVNQFLSSRTNRRRDCYGGSLENRARFLVEIYQGIRAAVGPRFPVAVKLNSRDNVARGVTVPEFLEVASMLDSIGIDAIEVSGGVVESGLTTTRGGVPMDLIMEKRSMIQRLALRLVLNKLRRQCAFFEGYHLDATAALKGRVTAPVIAVGGMRSRALMEETIARGRADFIGMCRPFIMQPDLAARMRVDPDFRVGCTSCNRCTFKTVVHYEPLRCQVRKS